MDNDKIICRRRSSVNQKINGVNECNEDSWYDSTCVGGVEVLATIERIEILDKVDELVQMILDSDLMKEYDRCLKEVQEDNNVVRLIQKFVKEKESYEEVQRFGKYHPDFKKVTTEVRELKRKLDINEKIASFKKAEENIQVLLDEISTVIGRSVSEYIKVPTGNPFFDALSSCGGGCGSGGSCGCS